MVSRWLSRLLILVLGAFLFASPMGCNSSGRRSATSGPGSGYSSG